MRTHQKGFGAIEILLILAAITIIGAVWFVWQSKSQSTGDITNSNSSKQEIPAYTSTIEAGSQTLTLKANDRVLMPSGAILSLANYSANSVPMFGYDADQKPDPNKQLSIISQLEAYHNGYKYKITTNGCIKENKTFDDYSQVVVTQCSVGVDIEQSDLQPLEPTSTSKQYTVTEKGNPITGPQTVLSNNPYLLVKGGDGRLTYPTNNAKPYLEANNGSSMSLTVISDYGLATVSFNAEELVTKTEKQVTIAGSTITIKPNKITCTIGYLQNGKCVIVNDTFVFDVAYERQATPNPDIVIYNLD
ncbi:MAG: hypothetical protein WAQ27_00690 [Candidatus Microsaccharimonas sp.]